MLPLFLSWNLAQVTPAPEVSKDLKIPIPVILKPSEPVAPPPVIEPQPFFVRQSVLPLPGELDRTPVFNSNSPEMIFGEGVLLSTFPRWGMAYPEAHLNYSFSGRFDVFTHHVVKQDVPDQVRSLYLGILVSNPGDRQVTIDIDSGASYLSQPDAPFIELPPMLDNDAGNVYAGPGSRVMNELLREKRQSTLPRRLVIPPRETRLLLEQPIVAKGVTPAFNGQSAYLKLFSDGRVYLASLAMYARPGEDGLEQIPTLEDWITLLKTSPLSSPRDKVPTPPDQPGQIIYGRVAGVSLGSQWQTEVYNNPKTWEMDVPEPGERVSYGLSLLRGGTQGTDQIQTAPLAVRYPDTAYAAHGNYGVHYNLIFPLHNPSRSDRQVVFRLETPLKRNTNNDGGLTFLNPLPNRIFFRGTVRVRYPDGRGLIQTKYYHLVQRQGQMGDPLVTLDLPSGGRRLVQVDFFYPPDATPPQVITVETLAKPSPTP